MLPRITFADSKTPLAISKAFELYITPTCCFCSWVQHHLSESATTSQLTESAGFTLKDY